MNKTDLSGIFGIFFISSFTTNERLLKAKKSPSWIFHHLLSVSGTNVKRGAVVILFNGNASPHTC